MTNEKKLNGLIGTLLVLSAFGGGVLLTEEEYEDAYYCEDKDQLGVFDRLSSTLKTGYWVEGGNNRRAYCSSTWLELNGYVESKGLNKKDFIKNTEPVVPNMPIVAGDGCTPGQTCYECTPIGCVRI